MEINQLPFEHKSSTLASECLANLGVPQLSEGTITSLAMHYINKGVQDREVLLHIFSTSDHGGGLQMLLSSVAAETTFVSSLQDEVVRMTLFRAAENELRVQKLVNAGVQLGISKFSNPQLMQRHSEHEILTLTDFQEKLLQRVTPSDPMMRR